jgi:cell division septation protein DedD
MRRILLTAILSGALCTAAYSDALLQRAADRERAGDTDGAASALAEWLSANPGAADSASVFDSYLRVEQDFPKLLQAAAGFLKKGKGAPGAAAQFERIARLFELSGRVEEARDAYLAAHAEGAPDSTLVCAFLLSLGMNDAESMSAALQQLKGRSPSSEILLQALSDLRAGNRGAARAALIGVAEQTGSPDLALKSLWVLYQEAHRAGDTAGQSDARAKLGKRFASAPETVLAAGVSGPGSPANRQVVLPAPAPDALAAAAAMPQPQAALDAAPSVSGQPQPSSPEASAPAGPAASAPAATVGSTPGAPTVSAPAAPASTQTAPVAPTAEVRYSVQAGSFQMKENADDLLLELGKRGFPATVVHDLAPGRDRWRVYAGSGLERDAAEAVRAKLAAAGFSGFLIQDK